MKKLLRIFTNPTRTRPSPPPPAKITPPPDLPGVLSRIPREFPSGEDLAAALEFYTHHREAPFAEVEAAVNLARDKAAARDKADVQAALRLETETLKTEIRAIKTKAGQARADRDRFKKQLKTTLETGYISAADLKAFGFTKKILKEISMEHLLTGQAPAKK
jgi:hypothetical protein